MKRIAEFVLKKPITTLLVVLSLFFFGIMSVINQKLEQIPEISMPMFVVQTTYAGAAPEDINELIIKPVEESVGTLNGLDSIISYAYENYGLTVLQYDYGTDMDNAYSDLRKRIDGVKASLPEDASEPNIIEMNMNDLVASMYITVSNKTTENVYNYINTQIKPELEKISSVASIDIYGGNKPYVSIEIIPEKAAQYGLNINSIASIVGTASYTMPAGTTVVGDSDMTISTQVKYDTPEAYEKIPITVSNGNVIFLSDIANISRTTEEGSIGRYNGEDTVMLAITKNQEYSAVQLSKAVKEELKKISENDLNFQYFIANDSADEVLSSVITMIETILAAIAISSIVLFVFYGDLKASLIVATSIPTAILTALISMWMFGYSLNVITLSSLVLGVGMMVDNSIVVLESCFRAKEEHGGESFKEYAQVAVKGTGIVGESVLGSTLTTCVVFLPLGFLNGLSGQFFKPLGMTIVFCMAASLISAVSLVPLCFVFYRPKEKEGAFAYKMIRSMQAGYRKIMISILSHKKAVMAVTISLFIGSIALATQIRAELIPETDSGTIQVSISTKPNIVSEKADEIYKNIENVIMQDNDLDYYMLTSSASSITGGTSIIAYLKDGRAKTTAETVRTWKTNLQNVSDCDINVSVYSQTSSMNVGSDFSLTLSNSDYDKLKETADAVTSALKQDQRLTSVVSSTDNAGSIIKVDMDPLAAAAEGLNPMQISGMLYTIINGNDADKIMVDGEEQDIKIEFSKDEYNSLNKVRNISFTSPAGKTVLLKDIANIYFADSPTRIARTDKQYSAEITAVYTDLADKNTQSDITEKYVKPNLTNGTKEVENARNEMMREEFTNLISAIVVAVFLLFIVMAAQFESPRFSFMVMTTIPFALIGSFSMLWLFDASISMPAMIGFLMLVGTVVNNGILYVDTVNQTVPLMDLESALIESGAIRLKPIMMTTLTTILSMVPLSLGLGSSGALMQGFAFVNIGGLTASTIMALIVLPVYYFYMNGNKQRIELFSEEEE